jgi:hypothetical protein
MTSEYYIVTVRHIQQFASEIAQRSTASIARTRTAPQSTGVMAVVRRISGMFGFDIAGVDDQLGDVLYNTVNAQQISSDVLQTILRNSRIAITRLTEDFTGVIGTVISGYWLYLYLQYCREVRRRRKEHGTVGTIFKKHNSRKDDDDGSGNGHKRLGNGGDDDGSGDCGGGACAPFRQLTM